MRALLIVVSAPILQFFPGIFKAHEPVCVQALGSEPLSAWVNCEPLTAPLMKPRGSEYEPCANSPQGEQLAEKHRKHQLGVHTSADRNRVAFIHGQRSVASLASSGSGLLTVGIDQRG